MSAFNDRPFAMGKFTGLRAFGVDTLGRLTGPHRDSVFTPGENVGRCHATPFDHLNASIAQAFVGDPRLRYIVPPGAPRPVAEGEHRVGGAGCACGFYAYFDGSNQSHTPGTTIEAIIDGYGVCTAGDRGFRAEKARLVALVDPSTPRVEIGRMHRAYDWLGDRAEFAVSVAGVWAVLALVGGIGVWMEGRPLAGALLLALVVPLACLLVVAFRASGHSFDRRHGLFKPLCAEPRKESRTDLARRFDLVRRNYPDVPVYPTLEAAVEAHPLTAPREPSPDDEDFWTRSAS